MNFYSAYIFRNPNSRGATYKPCIRIIRYNDEQGRAQVIIRAGNTEDLA